MSSLSNLPLSAMWIDDAMQVLDCSRRCLELFHLPADTADLGTVAQALEADAALGDELALATARLVDPGAVERFDWQCGAATGDHVIEVAVTAADDGTGTFFVTFHDATDTRRMEGIHLQARSYLEQILADIPLGVAVLDINLRITFINEAGLQQLSTIGPRRELIDVIGAQLPQLVPAAGQRWHDLGAQARDGGSRADAEREHLQPPQGCDAVVLDAAAHPLHDRRGAALGAILVLEDVTEKARLEGEVIRMERLATVGQMVITVNHEINNPLTIITASAQAARLLNRDLDEKTVAKLQMIEAQVKRISEVTERLRTMEEVQADDYITDGPKMIDIHKRPAGA